MSIKQSTPVSMATRTASHSLPVFSSLFSEWILQTKSAIHRRLLLVCPALVPGSRTPPFGWSRATFVLWWTSPSLFSSSGVCWVETCWNTFIPLTNHWIWAKDLVWSTNRLVSLGNEALTRWAAFKAADEPLEFEVQRFVFASFHGGSQRNVVSCRRRSPTTSRL